MKRIVLTIEDRDYDYMQGLSPTIREKFLRQAVNHFIRVSKKYPRLIDTDYTISFFPGPRKPRQ